MRNHSDFTGILGGFLLLSGLGLVVWGSSTKATGIVGVGVLLAVVGAVILVAVFVGAAVDPTGERTPEVEPVVVVPEHEAGEPPSAQLKNAVRKQVAGGYFMVLLIIWLATPVRAVEGWIVGVSATVLLAIVEEVHVHFAAKRRAKIEVMQPESSKKIGPT